MSVLANEWEQKDETIWKFISPENVKFHDSYDFTAEAVKANIDSYNIFDLKDVSME